LATGKLADVYSIGDNERDDKRSAESLPSLTPDGPRMIARLGASKREPGGQFICFDQDPNAEDFRWRVVWQISPGMLAAAGAIALGAAPVTRDGNIYFAWTQTVGGRRNTWVTSFAADRITDGPRWSVPVVEETGDGVVHWPQALTLAGTNVIYTTNAGLIVALDAATGRPAWATSYESNPLTQSSRGQGGDVFAWHGRLFVAPTDVNQFWALDIWTGQSLWLRPQPLRVRQIMGVIGNQVVVAVDGQWRGLAALNSINGKIDPLWGSLTAAPPYGRGVIVNDRILFPTRHAGIAALNLRGEPLLMPALWQVVNGGNIVFDRDFAVIAGSSELTILRFDRTGVAKK
jgi:outer membrane protein assembly factor BamB